MEQVSREVIANPTHNDLPGLMAMLIKQNADLLIRMKRLEEGQAERHERGEKLEGIAKIAKYFKVAPSTVQKWLNYKGAPIYNTGGARGKNFCYSQEFERYLHERNNKGSI